MEGRPVSLRQFTVQPTAIHCQHLYHLHDTGQHI